MWINKTEVFLSVRPIHRETGVGVLNVNVIQIYGRQIDGCGGYGGEDTVYVIEMHTDKCLPPSPSSAFKSEAPLAQSILEMNGRFMKLVFVY